MSSDGFNIALVCVGMVWVAALSPEPQTDLSTRMHKLVDTRPAVSFDVPTNDEAAEHMLALVLLGEAAHSSDDEVRAIVGVVLNRVASGAYGSQIEDVLMYQRKGVYAFTALDPKRAQPRRNVWARHLPKTHTYKRMRRIISDVLRDGANHSYTHYWHPAGMVPVGRVPRWARGRAAERIGEAMFTNGG